MEKKIGGIDDLRACPRNPRKISGEALAGLKVSLAQFGDVSGIVWNSRTGELVAGHQRLRALRGIYPGLVLEGERLVAPDGQAWGVRVVDWDEGQAAAAMVAANSSAIAGEWTDDLQGLLAELQAGDAELFEGLRFEELLEDVREVGAEADDVPEEFPEAVTQRGDVWEMGEHRLLCGDSTSEADVAKLFGTMQAAMAFTDPPYNVDYEGAAGKIANDALGEKFEAFLLAVMRLVVARTDGAIYVCMSSSELDTLQTAFRLAGGHWSTFLIWTKNHFTLGRSDYQRQFEPILYGWRKGAPSRQWFGGRDQGDVWQCDKPLSSKLHPTTKPVDLIVRSINNSSSRGELVLDLFGGSGSTLIACESTGRVGRLMELDPKFCDVIVRRWERFTGRVAVRIAGDVWK